MAVLGDNDRAAVNKEFQALCSELRDVFGAVTKAQVRAFIDAVDQWADDNAASFNAAIPQPARAQLTARQKALGFRLVVKRRWEVS